MTFQTITEPHFTGLTVTDSRGATLTIERNSNAVGAWIAPPGDNDGFSVLLDDTDRQQVAAFLTPEVADQLVAARAMCDELRDRNTDLTEKNAVAHNALRSLTQAYTDATGQQAPTAVDV